MMFLTQDTGMTYEQNLKMNIQVTENMENQMRWHLIQKQQRHSRRRSTDMRYVKGMKPQMRNYGSNSMMRECRRSKVKNTWKVLHATSASTRNKKVKMREMNLIIEDAERLQKLCKELTRSP